MKIKVFCPNQHGKIEFTPAELEKLLNDTYAEGQRNCNCHNGITWTNPYTMPYCNTNINNINNDKTIKAPEATLSITAKEMTEADKKRVQEEVSKMIGSFTALRAPELNDAFSNLAKELNF